MYFLSYSEVSRGSDTPLYLRKEQKINDRLQDKLNVLKKHEQKVLGVEKSRNSNERERKR